MNQRLYGIIFAMTVLWWTSTNMNAAEIELLQWKPVPGATYYVGSIEENGATFLVKTPSTWILTEAGTVKKIDAYNASGPVRMNITVSRSQHSLTVPLQAPEPVFEPSDEGVPNAEPTPEPTNEIDQPEPEAKVHKDDVNTTTETQEPESVDEQTTYSMHSRVGVSIGMGRQWLKSEIGISDFKGGANIGGTILSGAVMNSTSPLWYEGEFSAHNFTTETSKSTAAADTKTEEKNTQMRIRISTFFNFYQEVSSPLTGLSAGVGLQYLKHPILVIDNKQTGAATMKTDSVLSLNMGGRYSTLLSPKNLLATGLDITPYSFGKDVKTLSTSAFTEWLHLITPRIYTNLGLNLGRERITSATNCPAVTNCKNEGVTNSDLLQIRMGLAVGF